jgi:hypothetical protein
MATRFAYKKQRDGQGDYPDLGFFAILRGLSRAAGFLPLGLPRIMLEGHGRGYAHFGSR